MEVAGRGLDKVRRKERERVYFREFIFGWNFYITVSVIYFSHEIFARNSFLIFTKTL